MFTCCALIPVYNHSQKIASVVEELLALDLSIYLLDDGSDAACAQVLQKVASRHSSVTLLRWDVNRGKGAVVCDGLEKAFDDGFSHALQIDADGQHDILDVPNMLSAAQKMPKAVVSAWRLYEEMPTGRRRGRMLTDVWVWINTLSLSIKDSMCGFRIYPLAQTKQLLDKGAIGRRMDFDTDILVRLYWQGAEVTHVESKILYHDDIPSHFDLLRDNVRISWMHTKLFFGMLLRSPRLITRNIRKRFAKDVTYA